MNTHGGMWMRCLDCEERAFVNRHELNRRVPPTCSKCGSRALVESEDGRHRKALARAVGTERKDHFEKYLSQ